MYLPPLQPNRNPNISISGDVTIDERAAIASGAILHACPGSRIAIAAGVCVGMGSILQTYEGTLMIEEGAVIGAGVLIIGSGKIGTNACIGTATTILNCSVASGQILAPGSVLGDESRQWIDIEAVEASNGKESPSMPDSSTPEAPEPTPMGSAPLPQTASVPESQPPPPNGAAPPAASQPAADRSAETLPASVYGQQHINRLLLTLFPHKKMPSQPLEED